MQQKVRLLFSLINEMCGNGTREIESFFYLIAKKKGILRPVRIPAIAEQKLAGVGGQAGSRPAWSAQIFHEMGNL